MSQRYDRDDDLNLASLDFLGDSNVLRAQARRELDAAGGRIRPAAHHEGADRTDSIRVSVDAEGQVESVEITRGWQERIDPAGFPAALFEAYAAGVQKLITGSALAAFAKEEESGGDPFGLGRRPKSPFGPDERGTDRYARPRQVAEPEPDDRDWLAITRSTLDDLDDQLRRLDRIDIGLVAADDPERTLTSPHGHLTARIQGRGIAGITGDTQRIRGASTEQLRLEAIGLFRAVRAETGSHRAVSRGS
ncbi:hypothetical protein I0C86_19095 [Plantactinospora sp. S1510]|uniref:YbaB/EbfC DNA-binding family protein n=1 Tax=Plantactinospora alkalitolerans TaxID=2789879 RepID=A0ABS0GYN4_9ACTN|nr:hypothetical protein [Plantactinospora alkalitolerans]MBF9131048.1 hypothetical protein [Plantactinospora alkalitolerans]